MSADWPLVTINDIKADTKGAIAIGPFGSRMKSDCYVDIGVPVIRGTNITGGPTFEGKFVYITKEKADTLGSSNVYQHDLVFPHRGSIGEVGIILDDNHFVLSSSLMKLTCDRSRVNPKLIYYFFRSRLGRHELLKNASQVGTPGIGQPLTSLKSIEFRLPPLEIQNVIERMLTSLDKKIELNRQTNQTLEHIAQAIFKSWFVDFEPTRAKIAAKQNGQDPERAAMAAISGKTIEELNQLDVQGSTNVAGAGRAGAISSEQQQSLKITAALFPDALIDSELGEIPEGWEVKPFLKMVELIGGGTPKKSEETYWNGDIPWFSVKDAPASGDVFVIATELKITELGLNKSSTKLLPEGVTIISARGTVGRLALVGVATAMNQSCYGVKGANGIEAYLNYFNLKEAVSTLQQNTHGAVFDTITRDTFETVFLVNSSEELQEKFEECVTSIFKKIKNNLFECKSLEELRDSLLPKLLSGELDTNIKDVA